MPYPNYHPQSDVPLVLQARLRAQILALAPTAFPNCSSFRITFHIVSLAKNNTGNNYDSYGFGEQGVQAILTGARWGVWRKALVEGAGVMIGEEGRDVFAVALRALRYAVWQAREEEWRKEYEHWMYFNPPKPAGTQRSGRRLTADGKGAPECGLESPIDPAVRIVRRSSSSIINGRVFI